MRNSFETMGLSIVGDIPAYKHVYDACQSIIQLISNGVIRNPKTEEQYGWNEALSACTGVVSMHRDAATHATEWDETTNRTVKLLDIKSVNRERRFRPVANPVVIHKEYRLLAVIERTEGGIGEVVVLEFGSDTAKVMGDWTMKHWLNPAGDMEGVEWQFSPLNPGIPLDYCKPFTSPLNDADQNLIKRTMPTQEDIRKVGVRKANEILGLDVDENAGQSVIKAVYPPHARCFSCSRCCMAYKEEGVGGSMPQTGDIRKWHAFFHAAKASYGVEPVYDYLSVDRDDPESVKAAKGRGIDPGACDYLGPNGCVIPTEKRPVVCRSYRCPQWQYGWI